MDDDEFEDEYDDDEFFDDDEDIAEESEPQSQAEPDQDPVEVRPASEIPFSLKVEIGSLEMTLNELMQLKPGNILNIGEKPTESVRLMINHSCVGKGELVQIGDVLGVRVTEKA